MTKKTKGRDRLHGVATQKASDARNHTVVDSQIGWFNLSNPSRNRQQKKRMAEGVEKMSGATRHCHGCELWQTIEGDKEPTCLNLIHWVPDVPDDRYCFQPDASVFVSQLTEGGGNVK